MKYPVSDASANLHAGKWRDADPALGITPSIYKARDINALYDELINIITAGGLTPDEAQFDQVLDAINALIASAVAGVRNGVATALDTLAELAAALNNDANFYTNLIPRLVPVGTVIFRPGTVIPAGYIKINGALLLRADFPDLWAYANASGNIVSEASWAADSWGAFSSGDLATTFRLPDYRAEFFRIFDDGRGFDSGRSLGQWQADKFKSHTHTVNTSQFSNNTPSGYVTSANGGGINVNTGATGDAETRPRNVAVSAYIKY